MCNGRDTPFINRASVCNVLQGMIGDRRNDRAGETRPDVGGRGTRIPELGAVAWFFHSTCGRKRSGLHMCWRAPITLLRDLPYMGLFVLRSSPQLVRSMPPSTAHICQC